MHTTLFSWAGLGGSAVLALVVGCGGGGSASPGPGPVVPTITGVTLTPTTATAKIGATTQVSATVSGTGAYNCAVTWAVTGPAGWIGSAGSIDKTGLYESPFPAPPTATVTAFAAGDASKS